MNLILLTFERIRNIFSTDIDEQFMGLTKIFLFIQFIGFWLIFLFPKKNEISVAQKGAFKKNELTYQMKLNWLKKLIQSAKMCM